MKLLQIKINCKLLENQNFFIYSTAGKSIVDVSRYNHLLFQWHEESLYGSNLEVTIVNGRPGYMLSSYTWMEMLAKRPFNSFVEWRWDALAKVCSLLAGELFDEIQNNERSNNLLLPEKVKVPEKMTSEIPPEIWKEAVSSSFINKEITVEQFSKDWLTNAMCESPAYQKQMEFVNVLQEKGVPTSRIQDFVRVHKMDSDIGNKPFTLGVKIIEPNLDVDQDVDDWQVNIFLRGVKDTSKVIEWSSHSKAPASWKHFYQEVEEEIASWNILFPWFEEQLSEQDAWVFLTEAAEVLHLLGVEVLVPEWWKSLQNAKVKVKAKVNQRSESFVGLDALVDFNWQLAIDDKQLSAEEFEKLVEDNRKLIYVQGRWVRLDDHFMKRIQKMMQDAEEKGLTLYDFLQQDLSQAEEEDEGEYLQIKFEVNNALEKFIHQLKNYTEIPLSHTPQSFQGNLRPYQIQGMSWLLFLRKHHLGGCLADDMGLGKTIQIISYLLSLQEKGELDSPSLIVCPTSVLGNWQNELAKFASSLKVDLHYGSSRKQGEEFKKAYEGKHVVLTSYGIMQQDEEDFLSKEWNTIVLDEAQNIKNAYTKQSQVARKLRGKHHISVTGTPIENRLSELWSIFDFTIKGYLGTSSYFNKTFSTPIEKNGEAKKKVQLQKLIQPFLLRRSKKDKDIVLDLPDKLEQKGFVPLSTEQAVLYQNVVQDTMERIERSEGFERKGLVLQMLSKLKQVCNHPALFLKEEDAEDILARSGKTEKLMELLEVILEKDESTLIFTQFLGMGELIQQLIKERHGIDVPFLQGSMTKQQRDKVVSSFQNGEFPILLLSLKAGGTGLNLTAANHVIHFDRWWNPAVENQATDRAHRIGQKRFVHVHKLIASGTLEEKIDLMLDKKQALNEDIIQSDNWITELSTSELKELLELSV